MSHRPSPIVRGSFLLFLALGWPAPGEVTAQAVPRGDGPPRGRVLSHEETLRWVAERRAWRRARKTRPIWARPVEPGEVGKDYQTADGAVETARAGYWLCVGVAGEPWFQTLEKIEGKYTADGTRDHAYAFDDRPRTYRRYDPKPTAWNWVARVNGPGIAGFEIRPNYDPTRPLSAPAGGYVVRDDAPDPYAADPDDVWLVQQALFESTYELAP